MTNINQTVRAEHQALVITWEDTSENIEKYKIEVQCLSHCHCESVQYGECKVPDRKSNFLVRFYKLAAGINYIVRIRPVSKDGTRGERCDYISCFLQGKPVKPEVATKVY